MKAFIIAAGRGSRLGEITKDTPKCMLKINGKTLLEYQLHAYRLNGISEINVIKGFGHEKINYPGLKYHMNHDYLKNNILNSLMCASDEMTGPFIASYSDIVFSPQVVSQVSEHKGDIAVVVDLDWKNIYIGRPDHPIEEAEKIAADSTGYVQEIGKVFLNGLEPTGEFIGMFKCSAQGSAIFKEAFFEAKAKFWGKPFMRAKTFEQAYVTDFMQYLIESGIKVGCVSIRGGWQEIDVPTDLERAREHLKTKEYV